MNCRSFSRYSLLSSRFSLIGIIVLSPKYSKKVTNVDKKNKKEKGRKKTRPSRLTSASKPFVCSLFDIARALKTHTLKLSKDLNESPPASFASHRSRRSVARRCNSHVKLDASISRDTSHFRYRCLAVSDGTGCRAIGRAIIQVAWIRTRADLDIAGHRRPEATGSIESGRKYRKLTVCPFRTTGNCR